MNHLKRTYGDYSHIKEFLQKPTLSGAKSLWGRSKESRKYQRKYFDKAYKYAQGKYNQHGNQSVKTKQPPITDTMRKRKASTGVWSRQGSSKRSRTSKRTVTSKRKFSKKKSSFKRKGGKGGGGKTMVTNGYLSTNSLSYKKPKMAKYVEWAKQPITYEQCRTFLVAGADSATQGKQVVGMLNDNTNNSLCSSTQLLLIWAAHAKLRNITAPAWIALDPTPTSAEYNSLYLKNVRSEWTWTNQAPTTVECDLYIVQRRASEDGTWTTAMPLTDWLNGLTASAADLAAGTVDYYGAKPTASKEFNMKWRIVKVVKVVLEPGQEHKHVYNFSPKRVIDTGYLRTYDQGIKGIYTPAFMVCRGPVADTLHEKGVGLISTAQVKIVGIQRMSYTAYALNVFPRLVYQASNISTSNTNLYSIADAAGTVVDTEDNANYA